MSEIEEISTQLKNIVVSHANVNAQLRKINNNVAKIMRGLYGEKDNGTSGVIYELEMRELRISANENFRKKFVWILIGANFVFTGSVIVIVELIR